MSRIKFTCATRSLGEKAIIQASHINIKYCASQMIQLKNSWITPQTPSTKFILHYMLPGLLVFSIGILVRVYVSYSIGNSGDEFERWYQSTRVLEGIGMDRLDHHT